MVNARPQVPRNVERQLWSESSGFCMNPECLTKLITESTMQSIAEMAHIVPHTQGGDVSEENLILLCGNCHSETEPLRAQNCKKQLREWKSQAKQRIKQQFSKRFSSFDLLAKEVRPILERNHLIFITYGPTSDRSETHQLWLKFESELIANNSKLKFLLSQNLSLFHIENQETVKSFVLHADEFIQTREHKAKTRALLFPTGLLSMFDIKPEDTTLVPSVSALQNLIRQLKNEGDFIDLDLLPEPTLKYLADGETKCLSLKDRSNVQQIYFNRQLYVPKKTALRLESMLFFLGWLTNNGIEWTFNDYSDLTTLTLKGKYRVKLFYSYCLSISDLQNKSLNPGDHIVNLHNWNDGPTSDDAMEFAHTLDIKIYNQNEFFAFCHREIK